MHFDGQILRLMGVCVICNIWLISAKNDWPRELRMNTIPAPSFDADAPFCTANEACGFYSFSLKSRSLRWIKSWCRCSDEQQCVYEKTDLKLRVYRQMCVSKSDVVSGEEISQSPDLSIEHKHLLSGRSSRALQFL